MESATFTAGRDLPESDFRDAVPGERQPAVIRAELIVREAIRQAPGTTDQQLLGQGVPQASIPIPAGASQQVAGAVKHDFRGFGLVTFQDRELPSGGYVPDVDMKITAGSRQELAVGPPGNPAYPLGMGEGHEQLVGFHVAYLYREVALPAGHRQPPTIGMESQRYDRHRVRGEPLHLLAGGEVINADGTAVQLADCR